MPAEPLKDYRLPGDDAIFQAINGLDWPGVDAVFAAASERVFGIGAAVVLGLWLLSTLKLKAFRPILQTLIAVGITDRLGHVVLKPWFGRMRPCWALDEMSRRLLVDVSHSGSMPSLHSANAAAFAVALSLCLPGSWKITAPMALLIGISRIGVGVHWPSDVLAGFLFGALVGAAVHAVFAAVKGKMADAQANAAARG